MKPHFPKKYLWGLLTVYSFGWELRLGKWYLVSAVDDGWKYLYVSDDATPPDDYTDYKNRGFFIRKRRWSAEVTE